MTLRRQGKRNKSALLLSAAAAAVLAGAVLGCRGGRGREHEDVEYQGALEDGSPEADSKSGQRRFEPVGT
jgi:hypothetical protein